MSVYMSLFRWAGSPNRISQTEFYNRSTFSNTVTDIILLQTVSKCNWQKQLPRYFNPLSGNAPHFIILLFLTSDNFTCQEENLPLNGLIRISAYRMHPVYPVSGNVARCALLYYFTLSYAWRCYSSGGECLNPVYALQKNYPTMKT
jgi:hypothetical protein